MDCANHLAIAVELWNYLQEQICNIIMELQEYNISFIKNGQLYGYMLDPLKCVTNEVLAFVIYCIFNQ